MYVRELKTLFLVIAVVVVVVIANIKKKNGVGNDNIIEYVGRYHSLLCTYDDNYKWYMAG